MTIERTGIWGCKIGTEKVLPPGSDLPMRKAVEKAFREITGHDPEFVFSGWNMELTEPELAVVEDRLPRLMENENESKNDR